MEQFSHDTLLYLQTKDFKIVYDTGDVVCLAMFDIDGTIIKTKSGKKFAQGKDDWGFWDDSIPSRIRSLYDEKYNIIFFTNQAGISKGKTNKEDWIAKINSVVAQLGVPIQVFASTASDSFRKPSPRMFNYFLEYNKINRNSLNMEDSFYCGDAGGRQKGWNKKVKKAKDFSDSDRKFAMNLEFPFHTPDEYFLDEKPVSYVLSGFVPSPISSATASSKSELSMLDVSTLDVKDGEMIINIGYPGSGKTTFTKKLISVHPKYVHINRDTLKTMSKCLKVAEASIKAGKGVIIDNTNPTKKARAPFIKLAKKYNLYLRCVHFTTSLEHSRHNMNFRNFVTKNGVKRIPDVTYYTFRKRFEEPSTSQEDEGFSIINKIDFEIASDVPEEYYMYL